MNLESVMKLVDAGFTKQEIAAMIGAEKATETEAAQILAENEPETVPPDTEPQAAEPTPVNPDIAELTKQVSQLTSLVQKSNLLRMEMPEIKQPSAEDLIADIIYPTRGNNK